MIQTSPTLTVGSERLVRKMMLVPSALQAGCVLFSVLTRLLVRRSGGASEVDVADEHLVGALERDPAPVRGPAGLLLVVAGERELRAPSEEGEGEQVLRAGVLREPDAPVEPRPRRGGRGHGQ